MSFVHLMQCPCTFLNALAPLFKRFHPSMPSAPLLHSPMCFAGARTSPFAPLSSTSASKSALDALLLQRQQQAVGCHCVVHTCISPMPLPAPLSFPRALLPAPVAVAVGTAAAGAPSPYLQRSSKAPSVPAPGVLSRLTASSGFEPLLQGAARDLQRLSGYPAGRACFEEWGYSMSDLEELKESLLGMAGRYSVDFD